MLVGGVKAIATPIKTNRNGEQNALTVKVQIGFPRNKFCWCSKNFGIIELFPFHMSILYDDQRVHAAKVSFLCLKLGNVV